MVVYAVWHGGPNYARSEMSDLESFPRLKAAREAMQDRYRSGHWIPQDFPFVSKPHASALCPLVEEDCMEIYYSDPRNSSDPYPDVMMERGPRGGIQQNRY